MRIAVTGANGYVGTALCRHLLRQGIDVSALIRDSRDQQNPEPVTPHSASKITHPRLHYFPVDYNAPETVVHALHGVDAVIHLIAKTHTKDTFAEMEAYRSVNLGISQTVAEAAIQAGNKRLVFLSSIKVNGEGTTEPFKPSDQPAPTTAYGLSKLEAERALTDLCTGSIELVILRPPLVYSPDAKGNIHTLKKAIQKGIPLPLGSIHNQRDIIDLNLLCEYLYKSCTIPEADGQTLLVSNDSALSTTQLVRRIGTDIGKRPRLIPIPAVFLRTMGKLLGKTEQIDKLCGNLEVDASQAHQLLQPNPNLVQPTPNLGFRK